MPAPSLPTGSTDRCAQEGLYSAECMILTSPISIDGQVVIPAGGKLSDVVTQLFNLVHSYVPHYGAGSGITVAGDGSATNPYKLTLPVNPANNNPLKVTDGGLTFGWNDGVIGDLLTKIAATPALAQQLCTTLSTACGAAGGGDQPQQCAVPINLATSGLTTTNVTLTWQNRNGALPYSYSLEYKLGSASTYTSLGELMVNSADGDTLPAYTLNQLLPNTTYNWRVRRNCTSSEHSEWVSDQFTTHPIATPTGSCGAATSLSVSF